MNFVRVPFLDAIEDVSAGNAKVPQSAFLPTGNLAIVGQGQTAVAGYTNDDGLRVKQNSPLIVFGDHTRVFKYVDFPFAMGADGVKVLRVREGFDAKFVYHYLHSRTIQSAGYSRHFKFLKDLLVPRPPLDEQRWIALILDQAEALRGNRSEVLARLETLPQSIFRGIFGEPASWPERWPMGVIGQMTESVEYGTSAKAGAYGKWPILRMGNVTDTGRLDLSNLKYIDLAPQNIGRYTVRRGDMLFNRTNSREKVGKSCVVDTDKPLALAGYLVRVRFLPEHDAHFVSAYLTSPHGLAVRQRMAKAAVNQANINATEMKGIPIALPPARLQKEFANRLRSVDAQRAKVESGLALDRELVASLRARAFRGEL